MTNLDYKRASFKKNFFLLNTYYMYKLKKFKVRKDETEN